MGPLHNEHHPVSNEIISQNSGWMAASSNETPVSCPNVPLINNMDLGEGNSRSASRKQHFGHKYVTRRKSVEDQVKLM